MAMRFNAEARAKMAAVGYSVNGVELWGEFRTRYLVPARRTLGERAGHVEAEGRAITREAAVALAMGDSAMVRAAQRRGRSPCTLPISGVQGVGFLIAYGL